MTGNTEPLARDETLAALAERCVRAALPAVKARVEAGAKVEKNEAYVEVLRSPDGERAVSTSESIPNYASLLNEEYVATNHQVPYEKLDGYLDLKMYLYNKPIYTDLLNGPGSARFEGWGQRWFGMTVSQFLGRLVDRHIHIVGWDFNADFFSDSYVLLERGLLRGASDGQALTVDVLVPLYGVTFDTESDHSIDTDGASSRIELLTDDLLAACWPGAKLEDYEEQLLLRATHMWVQPSVSVTVDPFSGFVNPEDLDFSGLDRLLEITSLTAVIFGTNHVLYRPNNWVDWWIGPLPSASRWSWNYERSTAPLSELAKLTTNEKLRQDETQRRVGVLANAPHQVQLASRRLLMAARRDDPIDAVVDACIGIEALVGDDTPTDITYKLAIRTVALFNHAGYPGEPRMIFTTVKNLYTRRSKIVHGKLKPNDNNQVRAFEGTFSANSIGSVMLARLLEVVLDEPDLIGHIANDDLVLGRLGQAKEVSSEGSSPSG